ncbi:MAG: type II toxin-antitoxin system RelE/ParE family toxin [Chloroflexi bacterium]|nr:type II toxin-antitoxin system RelE/ParE family toxin [Chloroflexota bacterium]
MKVLFERSFAKDLRALKDRKLYGRVSQTIAEVKLAHDLSEVKQLTKLKGYSSFYRIRVGNYRIGMEVLEDTAIFVRILHRKDIYRFFP